MRTLSAPGLGSTIQKSVNSGNSSPSGLPVLMARPRADRPYSVPRATARK